MVNEKAVPGLSQLAEFRFLMRQFLSFSESRAEAAGITAQQYQLLQVVALSSAGYSISAIADRLLLRHNSAVELVDRAERGGLVVRVADNRDHRKSLVRLTESGEKIIARLVEEHLGYLQSTGGAILRALQPLIAPGQSRGIEQVNAALRSADAE